MTELEINTIAKRVAFCKNNRAHNKCKYGNCTNCTSVDSNLFLNLNPIQKAVIEDRAAMILYREKEIVRSRRLMLLKNMSVIAFLIIVVSVIALWFRQPKQTIRDYSPYEFPVEVDKSTKEYRTRIAITLRKTEQFVYDITDDGEVNCIDYTLTFYTLWNTYYPKQSANIEIVRNIGLNHLFVRTRKDVTSPWECIEPQADEYGPYFMEDFWFEYNPLLNVYGETDKWIMKLKSR